MVLCQTAQPNLTQIVGTTGDAACKVGEEHPLRCANCKKDGHGAADRMCEVYQAKLKAMRVRDPDSRYCLFPTNDPRTWGKTGEQAPMDHFDEACRADGHGQRSMAPHRWGERGRSNRSGVERSTSGPIRAGHGKGDGE